MGKDLGLDLKGRINTNRSAGSSQQMMFRLSVDPAIQCTAFHISCTEACRSPQPQGSASALAETPGSFRGTTGSLETTDDDDDVD